MTAVGQTAGPPAPTWHGQSPDAYQRYLAFVKQTGRGQRREQLVALDRSINRQRRDLEAYTGAIRELRASSAQYRARQEELQAQLLEIPTIEELRAEAERIKALPNMLGIRIDSRGLLVAQLRTFVRHEGVRYDMGDFEIALGQQRRRDELWVVETRKPGGYNPRFTHRENFDNLRHGTYDMNFRADFLPLRDLLRKGLLYEFLMVIIDRMCQIDEDYLDDLEALPANLAEDPAPVWRGFMGEFEEALGRTIDMLKNEPLKKQIKELHSEIENCERELRNHAESVRAINDRLRAAEAERLQLLAQPNEEVNEEAVLEEFRYITRLPGVMGTKFDREGIPVVHVRTSHELGGRRYDMGDFEVSFTRDTENGDERSVLRIVQTRKAKHEQHLYFHENYRNHEGTIAGWFCLGHRADEVSRYFVRGQYGLMMHLLINTMNGINDGARYHENLIQYYTEIPPNAIWRRRLRLRRRRRTPDETVRELGRLALDNHN